MNINYNPWKIPVVVVYKKGIGHIGHLRCYWKLLFQVATTTLLLVGTHLTTMSLIIL